MTAPWINIFNKNRAGVRAVAFPKFLAMSTVIGAKKQRVVYSGQVVDGAVWECGAKVRQFGRHRLGAIAFPQLRGVGNEKQRAARFGQVVRRGAIVARIDVLDENGSSCRTVGLP